MPLTINADTLPRYQTRAILGMVCILMLVVSAFFISTTYNAGYERIQQQWHQFEVRNQQKLRNEVDATLHYLNFTRQQTEQVLKQQIKSEVQQAVTLVRSMYAIESVRHADDPEAVASLIRESLRDLRFFDGRGYIFIDTLEGECVLLPTQPEIEGQSLLDNRDDTGHFIMQGLIDAVQNPNSNGYSAYRWYAPDYLDQMRDKIAYVEYFEPLNWIIGTGDYLYQVENDIKQQALQRLGSLRLDNDGYIAVLDNGGKVLLSPSRPGTEGLSLAGL
ncbi:MAG: diguanylate cyclase, partial [Oceanospirillales bacterium]|nr:diguanylate cyclase [Oceanospirillales bacterium]